MVHAAQGFPATSELIRKREAKIVMDSIRRALAEMIREEKRLLADRQMKAVSGARGTIWFNLGSGIFKKIVATRSCADRA